MIIHLKSFLGEGELQSKNVNLQNRGKIFKSINNSFRISYLTLGNYEIKPTFLSYNYTTREETHKKSYFSVVKL